MMRTTPTAMENDRLPGAHWLWSPNQDARPRNSVVDTIVIHGISLPAGTFGHGMVERLFTNRLPPSNEPSMISAAAMRVSSHLLIDRIGVITQFVAFNRRAWHAGPSFLEGRECVNDFSVGIELEGTDDCPYTPAQYNQLGVVCDWLRGSFPAIARHRIVGHSMIAPGRKTDPGPAFDWDCFLPGPKGGRQIS